MIVKAVTKLLKLSKKGSKRRYPIHRDPWGRTARQACFFQFDHGKGPSEAAEFVGVSLHTAYRYHHDWKHQGSYFAMRYKVAKALRQRSPDLSLETIKSLGAELGMSEEEVVERLQRPWGLHKLLRGQWPNYVEEQEKTNAEARLGAAVELLRIYEISGIPLEEIARVLDQLEDEYGNRNEDREGKQ